MWKDSAIPDTRYLRVACTTSLNGYSKWQSLCLARIIIIIVRRFLCVTIFIDFSFLRCFCRVFVVFVLIWINKYKKLLQVFLLSRCAEQSNRNRLPILQCHMIFGSIELKKQNEKHSSLCEFFLFFCKFLCKIAFHAQDANNATSIVRQCLWMYRNEFSVLMFVFFFGLAIYFWCIFVLSLI